jgi:diguanylate cyclase (GGDEF)-like protein
MITSGVIHHIHSPTVLGADSTVVAEGNGDIWVLSMGRLYTASEDALTPVDDWKGTKLIGLMVNAQGDLACRYAGNASSGTPYVDVGICVNRTFVSATDRRNFSGRPLCSLRDAQGDIWIGTDKGLYCIRDRTCSTFAAPSGLGGQPITSSLVDLGSHILVAEQDGWLYRYLGDTASKFAKVLRSHHPITSLMETSDGVYLCVVDGTVKQISQSTLKDYPLPGFDRKAFGPIVSLAAGTTDGLWVVGRSAVLSISQGTYRRYTLPEATIVTASYVDKEGRLWLGTEARLICAADNSVHIYGHGDGLPEMPIDSIVEDYWGNLWVGYDGAGVARFCKGHFVRITRKDGLPSNNIFQVYKDNADSLWFGSPKGIFRVSADELNAFADRRAAFHAYSYGPADGNFGESCLPGSQIAALSGWDSSVWFPCQYGVVRVETTNAIAQRPLVFDHVLIDGRPANGERTASFGPGNGNAFFQFTALDFRSPEHLQFSYRLIGFDTNWIDGSQIRQATYTNLPPGSYRFDLKCVNVDGGWAATRSFSFTLRPYFYQTWWFKVFAILAIVGTAYWFVRIRIRALQLRNQILQDLHTEIEAQNEELITNQTELEAQNNELAYLQAELEAQNQDLVETAGALEAANTKLYSLATTDGLTGLTNHRTFQDMLRREWDLARANGEPLSLLLIDVDHFKQFNDQYGHQAGDQVLMMVGKTLRDTTREGDQVARYGGEEFAVILKETNPANAIVVAERFRKAIEQNMWGTRTITASIGVSTLAEDMSGTDALIEAADIALYVSKRRGRNCSTHSDSASTVPIEQAA